MRSGRAGHRGASWTGIGLLIFGLLHVPLPQPDYHNVRHHDAPGEVCGYHDHLLRWHPAATVASDVAVLHWHWFLPSAPGEEPPAEGAGPAVHAHTPPWQAATWDDGPRLVSPDPGSRALARPVPCPLDLPLAVPGPTRFGALAARGMRSPQAFSATFAPGVLLNSLYQRWDC